MLFKRRSSQYQPILKKRSLKKYSYQDNKFIIEIKKNTVKYNVDNVARTNAYGMFYEKNKEMKWVRRTATVVLFKPLAEPKGRTEKAMAPFAYSLNPSWRWLAFGSAFGLILPRHESQVCQWFP